MVAEQLDFYPQTELQTRYVDIIDLDNINLLADSKIFFQKKAQNILNEREQKLVFGQGNDVPLAINVLSTVQKYLYEDNSSKKESYYQAIEQDSSRLLLEAMRKNSWEYYPPVYEEYDLTKNDLKANEIYLNEVLVNGLSPWAHKEEQAIRIQEFIEHQINLEIINLLPEDDSEVILLSIKECPDYVIDEYNNTNDLENSYGGYVPEVEKMVIQLTKLSKNGASIEQIGLPGKNINHHTIIQFLNEKQILCNSDLSKMELRQKQFIIRNPSITILDIVAQLDEYSSQKLAKNVFLGEVIKAREEKNYSKAVEQSISRQKTIETKVKNISHFLIDLCEQELDPIVAENELIKYLKKILFEHVLEHNDQAKTIFDERTAHNISIINNLIIDQKNDQALSLIKSTFRSAPRVGFCGAGSCGLIAINQFSQEAKVVHGLGLKGEVIKDTVRVCVFCGKKNIFYDSGGNKACASCKSSEINKKIKLNLRKSA